MKKRHWIIFANLLIFGCASRPPPEDGSTPAPPAAGIIRQVNPAEHYFIFESGKAIPTGTELRLLRKGRDIGVGRALNTREKKFQAADILEGAPRPGDLCEPKVSALRELQESQPGNESQGGRFRP